MFISCEEATMEELIRFKLNGKPASATLDGARTLLWVLRTEFALTGTKYGCGIGLCGACTVLVDGEANRACQIPVKDVKDREIVTIEGLAENGKLHPLQEAFTKHNAFQCGFCTPGMILGAYGLLLRNPKPTYAEVLEGMEYNLCRCGSYKRIAEAILAAAREMAGGKT
jgi:aerobic-type carbon monoxide dehydrogenase small subunit (CoxS/CutS family)